MIPGFESGIVGMKKGEEKDVKVTFPEKYQEANLAGKDAIFKIKMNSVSGPKLPELDAPFFESFGLKGNNDLDTFRKELKENMQKELDNAIRAQDQRTSNGWAAGYTRCKRSESPCEEEAARMRNQMVQQYGGGMKIEPDMLPPEMFSEQAEKRVKSSLVLGQ